MGIRKLKNRKCLCSITARAVICSCPDTDLLPLALCQSTSSKWSPALGESALILISVGLGFYGLILTVIHSYWSYLYVASHTLSGSYRWAVKLKMETLECHVRMTFSTGPKNFTLNPNELSWELDATFPTNLPSHPLSLRCYPPTLLLITSGSYFPRRPSSSMAVRNIHEHISGLWRPHWHLSLRQTSSLWEKRIADGMSEGVPTSSMQLGLQLITSSASTAGTGKSCANKPLLLSSENPDSMDQILTSRTAEETVCVY